MPLPPRGFGYFRRVLAVLAACCFTQCQPLEPTVLRLGTNVWPGYEPLYLAHELAAFDDPRLELVEYRSASQVLSGFQKGVIDLAAVTLDEAVRLAATGEDIEVVWVFDVSEGADQLLAQPHITKIADLVGKKIGVEESALGAFVLQRILDTYQLQSSDITVVGMAVSEHAQAMHQGSVDAVITFEPEKAKILAQGAHSLFSSKQLPGEIVDVLIARKAPHRRFSDQDLIRWLYAYEQTLNRVQKDLPAHLPLLNRRLKLPETDLRLAFSELKIPTRTSQLEFFHNKDKLAALIEKYQQALISRQLINQRCSCNTLLNSKYLEALP